MKNVEIAGYAKDHKQAVWLAKGIANWKKLIDVANARSDAEAAGDEQKAADLKFKIDIMLAEGDIFSPFKYQEYLEDFAENTYGYIGRGLEGYLEELGIHMKLISEPVVLPEAEQFALDHPTRLIDEQLERDYLNGPGCFIERDVSAMNFGDQDWDRLNLRKRQRIELYLELWNMLPELSDSELIFQHAKLCKMIFEDSVERNLNPDLTNAQKMSLLTVYMNYASAKDLENTVINKMIFLIENEDKSVLSRFNDRKHTFYGLRAFFNGAKRPVDPTLIYAECEQALYDMDREEEDPTYEDIENICGGVNPETIAMYNEHILLNS